MQHFHFGGIGPGGSSNSSSHLNFTQPDSKHDFLENESSQLKTDIDFKYLSKSFKQNKNDRDDVDIELSWTDFLTVFFVL